MAEPLNLMIVSEGERLYFTRRYGEIYVPGNVFRTPGDFFSVWMESEDVEVDEMHEAYASIIADYDRRRLFLYFSYWEPPLELENIFPEHTETLRELANTTSEGWAVIRAFLQVLWPGWQIHRVTIPSDWVMHKGSIDSMTFLPARPRISLSKSFDMELVCAMTALTFGQVPQHVPQHAKLADRVHRAVRDDLERLKREVLTTRSLRRLGRSPE